MKAENLVLFIYEAHLFLNYDSYYTCENYSIIPEYGPNILDYSLFKEIDTFIKRLYLEQEFELLKALFDDPNIIEKYIANNKNIIEYENLYLLLSKYSGIDNYIKLSNIKDNQKINILALIFQDFIYEQLVLSQTENTGYTKILQ